MQTTEEETRVVSVDCLRAQLIEVMSVYREGSAELQSQFDAVRDAQSYTDLLCCVNDASAGFMSLGVSDDRLKAVQTEALGQLRRIEEEHAKSTSLDALRARLIGVVHDTEWPLTEIREATTYEELWTALGEAIFFFGEARFYRIGSRLAEIRAVLKSKISQV